MLESFVATVKAVFFCAAAVIAGCALPRRPSLVASLDSVTSRNAIQHGIPAQAVAVMRNGAFIYRQSAGRTAITGGRALDDSTVFPAFSVSKLVGSVILLQLVEQGKVDLTAPASRYIDELPTAWRAITVEQFLDHVSGVPEYFDFGKPAEPLPASVSAVFAALADRPFVDPPGTRSRYTSTNYLVIGAIIEAVTGRSYADEVRSRIIAPLSLRHSFFGAESVPRDRLVASYHGENGQLVPDVPIPWRSYATMHGELFSTAQDLAVLLSAVAEGRLLPRASLVRLWRPYAFANGNSGVFASGWEYGERGVWREVGHDGGAKVRARIVYRDDLREHVVIVYLTNGSVDNVWSRTLLESVQQLVLP